VPVIQGRRVAAPWLSLRRQGVPLLLAVSGWVVLAITVLGGSEPVRAVAVFAFVLVIPGLALVRLLPVRDFLERAVLAAALGLSLATLTAEVFAISHILGPSLVLVVLACICSIAALTEIMRGLKAPW
jgi:uncharacterized membrane protein